MTPEAQRIAIAKVLGFTQHTERIEHTDGYQWTETRAYWLDPSNKRACLPDYLNDVRAAHAAVLSIGADHPGWDDGHFPENFVRELQHVVGGVPGCLAQYIATADQVCEALLRAIDLWTE